MHSVCRTEKHVVNQKLNALSHGLPETPLACAEFGAVIFHFAFIFILGNSASQAIACTMNTSLFIFNLLYPIPSRDLIFSQKWWLCGVITFCFKPAVVGQD